MKRRSFIALLAGSAASSRSICPTSAQSRMLRVGAATPAPSSPIYAVSIGSVLRGMSDLGYEEGRNFIFEQMPLHSRTPAEFDHIYQELASRNVDIFVAIGVEQALKSAIAAAAMKPIVMVAVNWDPISRGYVSSLARPGGNITGVMFREVELTLKRFQLMTEIIPGLKAATVFWDSVTSDQWQNAQVAATKLGLRIHGVKFDEPSPYDFESAFTHVAPEFHGALIILGSPFFAYPKRNALPDFALRHRIPTMFVLRQYVDRGGLASYGPKYAKMFARAAYFVDRIAKRTASAELPIELPTQFELVVNEKTARALGVTIPPAILLRADKLIE
jgi:putative ABC transport system substrate-binding protein